MFCNKVWRTALVFASLIGWISPCMAAPIRVVAITQDFASIAHAIGADRVKVESLIKGSRDLHHIDPKPSMVVKVRRADLLIRLGLEQDSWIDGIIQVAKNTHVLPGAPGYLDASTTIEKREVPTGKIDGRLGDVHKLGNPHYWLSPENGLVIAAQIRDRLAAIDPDHAGLYHDNFDRFEAELTTNIEKWRTRLAPYRGDTFVTYHKVWTYFFEAFDLTSSGQLEPLPGIPPTTRHLAKLKRQLKDDTRESIVLMASFYNAKAGRRFAQSTNSRLIVTPINVGEDGISDYIGLIDHIVTQITQHD